MSIRKNSKCKMIFGITIILVLIIMSSFPNLFTNFRPDEMFDERLASMSSNHILGTDGLGRDLFTLVLYSMKNTLIAGISIALVSGILGIIIGSISVLCVPTIDAFLVEFINIFSVIPTIFLVLMWTSVSEMGMIGFVIVVSLSFWTGTARIMRSQVKGCLSESYIETLFRLGIPRYRILFHHILPNNIKPILANITLNMANACVLECGMSYINISGCEYSLGKIISHGQKYLLSSSRLTIIPIVVIVLLCYSFLLIADSLNGEE